jgi:hypothetical protein
VNSALYPNSHRWTFKRYQRLADVGLIFNHRVELLGGEIVEHAEQTVPHAVAVMLAMNAVSRSFGDAFWPRVLGPLHLDRWSCPEPDIAVVPGGPRDYIGTGHPKSALLVVEVSDTTLWFDRKRKGPRYARAQYQDYWIVNLIDRCVEVYRKPVADPSARLGWRYADVSILKPPASIKPMAASGEIQIADLLP